MMRCKVANWLVSAFAWFSFLFTNSSLVTVVEATTYNVGPGQAYDSIAAVLDSYTLVAGDEIAIHYRPSPYYEKFVLNNAGTAANPIIVRGVPDTVTGALPILDGDGADTPTTQNYWNEPRGLVKIGGASTPSEGAAYVVVEYLELRNARPGYVFQNDNGSTEGYAENAACVYVEKGSHITIRHNEITNCCNGIFVTPGVDNVAIEHNYIHGNGDGTVYTHNTYTEALGIIYRFNRFGPLCSGCLGNNLKDRSAGSTIAYNFIEGGNRQLDLVDGGGTTRADARYGSEDYVFGNVLIENNDGNRQVIHYGGDQGTDVNYRQGPLHFYHNTVFSSRAGRTTLIRLSAESVSCDARNNLIYIEQDGNNQLELLSEKRGTLTLHSTWMKANYQYWVSHVGSGSISETNTIIGTNPGFTGIDFSSSLDFHLGNSLLGTASLAANAPPIDEEYVMHMGKRNRVGTNIGAYGYDNNTLIPNPGPTPGPTLKPTPGQTPAPSSSPTPPPTNNPSAGPTPSPTSKPTPGPTPSPTSVPTASPSANPTPVPTDKPTPHPTSDPVDQPTPAPETWELIVNETFESGAFSETIFAGGDGGADATITTQGASVSGQYTLRLRDNSKSSVATTVEIYIIPYQKVRLSFHFQTRNVVDDETFELRYRTNEILWESKAFAMGIDWASNKSWTTVTLEDINVQSIDWIQFQFETEFDSNRQKLYIDDMKLEGISV